MVSVDTPEENKKFAEQEQADFPMLSDPGKDVAKAYGVLPPPNPDRPDAPQYARRWMFFIDGTGKIVHIEKTAHTADAGDYLAKELEALGVKKK